MVGDLSKLWSKFSLSAEESAEVEIQKEALEEIMTRGRWCLVGKLPADQMVPKESDQKHYEAGVKIDGRD
jgi:hypothetical protein